MHVFLLSLAANRRPSRGLLQSCDCVLYCRQVFINFSSQECLNAYGISWAIHHLPHYRSTVIILCNVYVYSSTTNNINFHSHNNVMHAYESIRESEDQLCVFHGNLLVVSIDVWRRGNCHTPPPPPVSTEYPLFNIHLISTGGYTIKHL